MRRPMMSIGNRFIFVILRCFSALLTKVVQMQLAFNHSDEGFLGGNECVYTDKGFFAERDYPI